MICAILRRRQPARKPQEERERSRRSKGLGDVGVDYTSFSAEGGKTILGDECSHYFSGRQTPSLAAESARPAPADYAGHWPAHGSRPVGLPRLANGSWRREARKHCNAGRRLRRHGKCYSRCLSRFHNLRGPNQVVSAADQAPEANADITAGSGADRFAVYFERPESRRPQHTGGAPTAHFSSVLDFWQFVVSSAGDYLQPVSRPI